MTALLVDDPEAITAYERHHADVWPEVIKDNVRFGALRVFIYRDGRRLFMFVEGDDRFDVDEFGRLLRDQGHPRTHEWLALMDSLMVPADGTESGFRWTVLPEVCALDYGQ